MFVYLKNDKHLSNWTSLIHRIRINGKYPFAWLLAKGFTDKSYLLSRYATNNYLSNWLYFSMVLSISVNMLLKFIVPRCSNFICVWYSSDENRYSDVLIGAMVSQITSISIVYSTVYSGVDQRKYQSSASTASRWLVNSPHKGPVSRKILPFDDLIIWWAVFIWISVKIQFMNFRVVSDNTSLLVQAQGPNHDLVHMENTTEALKGHRVVWKIEIYYLIRMT